MPFHTRKWDFLRGIFDDLSDVAHESADWVERYPYEYWRQLQTIPSYLRVGPTGPYFHPQVIGAVNPLSPLVGSLTDTAGEEAAALVNRNIHPDYQIDPKDMSNIIRGVTSVAPGLRTSIPNFYNSARSFFNKIRRSTPKHIQELAQLPQNKKLLNDLKESGAWEKIIALPPNESINTADLPYYPPEMIFDVQSTDPAQYGPRVETTSYLSEIADADLQTESETTELQHQADELYTSIFGDKVLGSTQVPAPEQRTQFFWKAGITGSDYSSSIPTPSGTGWPNFKQLYGATDMVAYSEFLEDRGISTEDVYQAVKNRMEDEPYDNLKRDFAQEVLNDMGNEGWMDHVAVKLGIGPDRHSINFEDPFDDKGFFGIPVPKSLYFNRKVKYLYDRVRDRGIDPEGKSVMDLINLEATTTVPIEERYLGDDLSVYEHTSTVRSYLNNSDGNVQKAYDQARNDFLVYQKWLKDTGEDDRQEGIRGSLYSQAKVTQQLGDMLESGTTHVPTQARHIPSQDGTTGGPLTSGEANYRELVVKYQYPSDSDRSKLGIGEVDEDAHFGPGTIGWARTTDKYISSADDRNMPEDLWMKAQSEGYRNGIATSHLDELQSEHQKAAGIRKNNVDREILGDLLKNYDIYLYKDAGGDILPEIAEIRIKPGFHRPAFYAKQKGEIFDLPEELGGTVTDVDGTLWVRYNNPSFDAPLDEIRDNFTVQVTEQMVYEATMINRDSSVSIAGADDHFVYASNKVTDAIKKATKNSDLLDVIRERQKIAREKYPLEYAYRELGVDYDTPAMRRFTETGMKEPVLENAPYKTEWLNIAVKNFLWDAAMKGNDYISWSSPEFLKDRWSGDTASKEGGLFDVVYGTQIEKLIRKELRSLSVEREGVPVRLRTYKGKDNYIIEFPKDIRDALIEKGQDPEKGFELSKLRKKLEEAYA